MLRNFLFIIVLLSFQACKFNGPDELTLLTNGTCLEWELVSCESNVEALNSNDNSNVLMRFCESGKGVITENDNAIVISWHFEKKQTKNKLCWTDNSGEQYCYDVELLTKTKMVLVKDNKKTDDYKKRVVCTYKPLESF